MSAVRAGRTQCIYGVQITRFAERTIELRTCNFIIDWVVGETTHVQFYLDEIAGTHRYPFHHERHRSE